MDHAGGERRVVLVVEVLVNDLAPVYPAVRVDVLEIGVRRRGDLAVTGRSHAGQRLVAPDRNGRGGDPGRGCGERATRASRRGGSAGTARGQGYRQGRQTADDR